MLWVDSSQAAPRPRPWPSILRYVAVWVARFQWPSMCVVVLNDLYLSFSSFSYHFMFSQDGVFLRVVEIFRVIFFILCLLIFSRWGTRNMGSELSFSETVNTVTALKVYRR